MGFFRWSPVRRVCYGQGVRTAPGDDGRAGYRPALPESMPKNKRLKFERVGRLPNVTLTDDPAPAADGPWPWEDDRFAGMPMLLELGCGKGEHSLAFAAADPRRLCVGVDTKSHRICVGAETAIARGLANVHFLRARVENLRSFFAAGAIDAIWLTFPDPQIKNRTVNRRLSAPSFLDAYAALLRSGGRVHLKTDSVRFCDYTRQSVLRWGGRVVAACEDIHAAGEPSHRALAATSAYEADALAKGRPIRYLAFTLS